MFVSTEKALGWIADEKGRTLKANRQELLARLNDVRRLLYSLRHKIALDFHIEACFQVKDYYEPCLTCNCEPQSYLGITLPHEMEQVESAWVETIPIPIHNRWLEYRDGIYGRGGLVKIIDVGNDFPIQGDWHPKKCIRPAFVATNAEDCGKEVEVSFLDSTFAERHERVKLTLSGGSTLSEASSLKRPGGIVLPQDLKGGVVVYDCIGGAQLGHLHPKPQVSVFRRVKVAGVCCGSLIRVRATRRFTELEFDWEIVETDNKLAIIEASRYLDIMAVNSSDAQWLAKARAHMENVIVYLGGDNMRDEGPATIRELDFLKQPVRRTKLISRRR